MAKCAECGKEVDKEDMIGDLCESCYDEEYARWFGGASQNEDGEYDV